VRLTLFLVAITILTGVVVAATVFRSSSALHILHRLRLIGLIYVAAIVIIAGWRLWQQGGL
jgi:hypothetical protein